jgi:C1A family cysteine protease
MSFLPISPAGRRYGRFPDNPFQPAKKLLALRFDPSIILPAKAATSQFMGPIRNQGNEGSCTGQMKAEVRDLLYRAQYQWEANKSVSPADFESSAEFSYLANLIYDGDLGTDAGSTIHASFITLNSQGVCLDSQMPYSDSQYSKAPTSAEYADALVYKPGAYHSLPDLPTMKACIASGYSFGFGINVYSSFEGTWPESGFMPMPDLNNEQLLGGHAQHGMDYNDTIQFPDGNVGGIFVQNSWGTPDIWPQGISAAGRTDGGCYWMPYAYFTGSDPSNGPYVSDCWMIHLNGPWKANALPTN